VISCGRWRTTIGASADTEAGEPAGVLAGGGDDELAVEVVVGVVDGAGEVVVGAGVEVVVGAGEVVVVVVVVVGAGEVVVVAGEVVAGAVAGGFALPSWTAVSP